MKTIELDDPWLLNVSEKLRNQLEPSHKNTREGQIIYVAIGKESQMTEKFNLL